ncbi:YbaN family protein [Marivibrio halodurans]|uniref:YbaN family protein n=1 Tax=Marivibrio halodurans TaxID=2039722 RepID=A0A8J7RWG3_9PROT|nr:YbaN family protein [Marivibrio halodurans]MBP5855962.1 YbaN family protein [Marivibrio halodurans]
MRTDRCPNDLPQDAAPKALCRPMRLMLQAFGGCCLAIGIAGVVLPGLPGTVFLLLALWAFSKSSARLHLWLFNHPRFGAPLRAWHAHRAIPRAAKCMALGMMTASFAALCLIGGGLTPAAAIAGASMAAVGTWIATRPEGSPLPVVAPEAQIGR